MSVRHFTDAVRITVQKMNYSPSHIAQITDFFFNFSMETAHKNLKLSQNFKIIYPNYKHKNYLLMWSSCEEQVEYNI